MLESIRSNQRVMLALLLLLILPSFVFFGVQGYQQFLSSDDSVATVGGRAISRAEFDRALRAQIDRMRQTLGSSVDARLLDSPEVRREVLDGLIAQRALAGRAAAARIGVTDAELARAIAATPGLTRPDGSFDMERYRAALAAQGLSEPAFEQQMRADLAVQAVPELVARTAVAPKAVAERLAAIAGQVRDVREQRFEPAAFADRAKATPDLMKRYYEANAKRFETPEAARVEYVVLSADAIARQLSVPPDELRAYYEQNKARYATAEERRASHILVRLDAGASAEQKRDARAKAEQLLARVRAAPDQFEAVARADSQDPGSAAQGGDLGFFTRDAMVKPFADAAWTLREGEISGIVESSFGLHIIKLTGVKPGAQKSFDDVRAEVESEVRRQLASQRFAEAADTFSNLVEDQSDNLKPAAERFKLPIQAADGVRRQPGADAAAGAPLSSPKLLAALFTDESIASKRNTAAIDVAPNTLVAARIVDYQPARQRPLEAVEAEVRQAVLAEEARRLAIEAGQARLKALREGAAPEAMSAARAVTRGAPAGLAPQAVEAVFSADTGKLPSFVGVELGEQGYGVYAVTAVHEGADDAAARSRAQQIAQQLAQVLAQQDQIDYIDAVKAGAKPVVHAERLGQAGEPR